MKSEIFQTSNSYFLLNFQKKLSVSAFLRLKNHLGKMAIELEQETDGRWIAEIDALDGVLVYGETRKGAIKKVKTLALQVIAERLESES